MPIETFYISSHTISNKLVSKVFAQKKGEKSYDSSNMCSNFGGFRCGHPLIQHVCDCFGCDICFYAHGHCLPMDAALPSHTIALYV